jgi:hypothetical protein
MEKNRPNRPESVPYIVFEGEIARQERHIKRLWIALLATVAACVLIVGGFLWYLNQYDFTSYEQDGEGINILGTSNGGDCNVTANANPNQEEPVNSQGPSDTQNP